MNNEYAITRRAALRLAATAGAGLVLAGCGTAARQPADGLGASPPSNGEAQEGISPTEDLMREHGVLGRVLLIYDESIRRLIALPEQAEVRVDVIAASANIVRRFIEQYHEKLEEDEIFPRFQRAGKFVDLTQTLLRQHQTGRTATENIIRLATPDVRDSTAQRRELVNNLVMFNRMYRPHKAREDTVLFPAFHQIVSPREMDELGDRFEGREQELFGAQGFEGTVQQVASLEQMLGIYDLDRFTPPVAGTV